MGTISRAEAKAFYDRLGRRQDWQAFYEDPALEDLIAHGRFDSAQAVCEFGCGTGRLAARLLEDHLPGTATYLGLDVSTTMVGLASTRLAPWSGRARVLRTDGSPAIPAADGSLDWVFSTYVVDLLSDADIAGLLAEAGRVLRPGGLFCNVSLTFGQGPFSRAVCALWQKVHDRGPLLLGGCRPVALRKDLNETQWRLAHSAVVCRFGICSEIVTAQPGP